MVASPTSYSSASSAIVSPATFAAGGCSPTPDQRNRMASRQRTARGQTKSPAGFPWAGLGTLAQGCRPVVRKRRSLHRTLKAYSLRSSWSVHTRANCSPALLFARALAAPAARRLAGHPSRAADRQRTARGKRNAPPDGSHSGAKDIAPPDGEPQRCSTARLYVPSTK